MSSTTEYRDRVYIREDVLLRLMQYRELNQTALLSYCGLNLQKHESLLDEMENKGLISKSEEFGGKKKVVIYRITEVGVGFCKKILHVIASHSSLFFGSSAFLTIYVAGLKPSYLQGIQKRLVSPSTFNRKSNLC